MQIVNITDCQGSNAELRLNLRINSLFHDAKVEHTGVSSPLEAGGNIIDSLDAVLPGAPCIIMANIAPRGNKDKYPNGAPFCFAYFENNIVIGTPETFSILKKFGLVSKINETDVLTVCKKFLDKSEANRITNSQFRSYEYLPRLAKWLSDKKEVPFKEIEIPALAGNYVWCTDRFTEDPDEKVNCKTTALEISEITNQVLSKLPFYERLTDVPKNEAAIVRGSSGYKNRRFLEVVIQGGSAAKTFGLKVGSNV